MPLKQPGQNEIESTNDPKNNETELYNIWADIVISLLSVNQHPVEKTYRIYNQLQDNGLFDLQNLATWNHDKIFKTLRKSGYERGDYMLGLFTERLMSLGASASKLEDNINILTKGTEHDVTALLTGVKGVGPVVIKNFLGIRKK